LWKTAKRGSLIDNLDGSRRLNDRQTQPRSALGHSVERCHGYSRQRLRRHLRVVRQRGSGRLSLRLPDLSVPLRPRGYSDRRQRVRICRGLVLRRRRLRGRGSDASECWREYQCGDDKKTRMRAASFAAAIIDRQHVTPQRRNRNPSPRFWLIELRLRPHADCTTTGLNSLGHPAQRARA
jgi:hypothetical protein